MRAGIVLALLGLTLGGLLGASILWLYRAAPMPWVWSLERWAQGRTWAMSQGSNGLGMRVLKFRERRFSERMVKLCAQVDVATRDRRNIPWWAGRWGGSLWVGPGGQAVRYYAQSASFFEGQAFITTSDDFAIRFRSASGYQFEERHARVRLNDRDGLAPVDIISHFGCPKCVLKATLWTQPPNPDATRSAQDLELLPPFCEYLEQKVVPGRIMAVDYETLGQHGWHGERRLDWGGWMDRGAEDGVVNGSTLRNNRLEAEARVVWTEPHRSFLSATAQLDGRWPMEEEPQDLTTGEWRYHHDCAE